jgi:hypothetical protein
MPSRTAIVTALQEALAPLDYVHSFFEAGSTAFGADDDLSDIDLVVDAAAGRADEVFAVVETTLTELAPFDYRWLVPEPAWHGYSQRFYHLAGSPEFLYVDFLVRADGQPPRLNEREQHGQPRVYFDRTGITTPAQLDPEQLKTTLHQRVLALAGPFPMLAANVRKELRRGRPIDAMAFYQTGVLRPLVELLRIRYCPERYSFGLRYLQRDLPPDAAAEVEHLSYAAGPAELAQHVATAERWFGELQTILRAGQ